MLEKGGRAMRMEYLASKVAISVVAVGWGVLAVPGCGCSASASPGLDVFVVDKATGADICDATVTATDGTYVEMLYVEKLQTSHGALGHTCDYLGAWGRLGTYSVRVNETKYQPSREDNVVVSSADRCGNPQAVTITVMLVR
jgi:hypothetical protein